MLDSLNILDISVNESDLEHIDEDKEAISRLQRMLDGDMGLDDGQDANEEEEDEEPDEFDDDEEVRVVTMVLTCTYTNRGTTTRRVISMMEMIWEWVMALGVMRKTGFNNLQHSKSGMSSLSMRVLLDLQRE